MGGAVRSSATRELTLLHARELLRDGKYFYFALLFPFGMLGLFLGINALLPDEPGAPDFTSMVIPISLFLAVTSTALTVTAGPLVEMRAKGTLRLLGTTPVGRARVVVTHMAVRAAMVVVQSVLLLSVAVALGVVPVAAVPAMFGITLLGLGMFGAVGYLIGGRLTSPNAAAHLANLFQLASLFLSGLTIPLWLMPAPVAEVLGLLPTTFYVDLMMSRVTGADPNHPVWLSVVVMVGVTVVVAWASVRTFRWDDGERS